jgi:hypothetical protein
MQSINCECARVDTKLNALRATLKSQPFFDGEYPM